MSQVPVAVIDTNVVVSGLINPFGKPGLIVDLLLSRRLRLAFDDRILSEYRSVLGRPRFAFEQASLDRFFEIFQFQEHVSALPWPSLPLPDTSDVIFLEVASAAKAALVTGNLRHYPEEQRRDVNVMTPAQWLEAWAQ